MNIQDLIQLQILKHKAAHNAGNPLIDRLMEDAPDTVVRQMCAKVSHDLVERLDAACNFLGVSKRAFIEASVTTAVEDAEHRISEVLDQVDAFEDLPAKPAKKGGR